MENMEGIADAIIVIAVLWMIFGSPVNIHIHRHYDNKDSDKKD